MAALYLNHPYGPPGDRLAPRDRGARPRDALAFYRRFYAPNNAILVIRRRSMPPKFARWRKRPSARSRRSPRSPKNACVRRSRSRSRRARDIGRPQVEQPSLKRYYWFHQPRRSTWRESGARVLAQLMGAAATPTCIARWSTGRSRSAPVPAIRHLARRHTVHDLGRAETGRRVLADRAGNRRRDLRCRDASSRRPEDLEASRPSSLRRRSTPRTTRRRWRAGMAAH